MRTLFVTQSNYIPWKGYFDAIRAADRFVVLDDVQYTKNDWRNRNVIKTPNGLRWLTIPVRHEHLDQKISETHVADDGWAERHWRLLSQNYLHARHFGRYRDIIEDTYRSVSSRELSAINRHFFRTIFELLGISTPVSPSSEFTLAGNKNERLISLMRQSGATEYLTTPKALSYLDVPAFEKEGYRVRVLSFEGYPEYPQQHGPFEHHVSVLDLLFNVGPSALSYMIDYRDTNEAER